MPNIDKQLALAARITQARQELAALEAEFAGMTSPPKPRQSAGPSAKGGVPVSQRVLNMLTDAGHQGLAAADIKAVISGRDAAVDSALQAHRTGGRIVNRDGRWYIAVERITRPIRIPLDAIADAQA